MNILDKLERRAKGRRYPVYVNAQRVRLHGQPGARAFNDRDEYELTVELGVGFIANSVELPRAERDARQRIQRMLYGDLYDLAMEIHSTSHDSDARDLAGRMLAIMTED